MVTAADVERAGAPRDLRSVIAERTARSKREVPHYYLRIEVDFGALRAARAGAPPPAPGYTDFVVKACARALREHPECNVSWRGGRCEPLPAVAVGVAVEVPQGILVATIVDPDRLALPELHLRLAAAIEAARAGRVGEPGPRSMVVSNLGMFGVDEFQAIIDPPDPMVLAVGAVRERVVAVAAAPAVRPTAYLTLSADHRVLDGAPAARWLARVRALLESPGDLA
jgi:pyruvate dehydrogenase E2 component (dihydrolipoamide acetyltransferase)